DVAVEELQLAGVEPGADLEVQTADGVGDRARAVNRACWSVEGRQRAVAGPGDHRSPEALDLPVEGGVEIAPHFPPAPVAQLSGTPGRAHHVREQDGGEDPI